MDFEVLETDSCTVNVQGCWSDPSTIPPLGLTSITSHLSP